MPKRPIASVSLMPSLSVRLRSSSGFIVPEAGARPEQAAPEARAFFVRPIDQPDGDGRRAFAGDTAQHFHPGEHVQAAVEPAAVGHGIHVPADQQFALGFAAQGRPGVARFVGFHLDGKLRQLFRQPVARGLPGIGKGDALRAVVVAGEPAQVFQFVNRALGLREPSEFPII